MGEGESPLPFLATVDNNDTVSYGCIRVALKLQPSEENAALMKRVRQIGIYPRVRTKRGPSSPITPFAIKPHFERTF